jgi:hypothetical protein
MARPTFTQACAKYPHRFTMTHVPAWASRQLSDGSYCAPQYASCQEWYESTIFPGQREYPFGDRDMDAFSSGQTWPLGVNLPAPYVIDSAQPVSA